MKFAEQLALGHVGEQLVAQYIQRHGCGIVPSYDYSGKHGDKAPRLMFENSGLVLPDLDVCKRGRQRFWAEVKSYWNAYPNRTLGKDVHGITGRLYRHYLEVEHVSGCPVFVFVLEVETGALLLVRLSAVQVHPCMCRACKDGQQCIARIHSGIYWTRESMRLLDRFDAATMQGLRSRWVVSHRRKGTA